MNHEYRCKFLLIDDAHLQEVHNLRRKVNAAVKHPEPVLKLDAPWDQQKSDTFNHTNVLYDEDEKLFKMWYVVTGKTPGVYWGHGCKTAYATSTDGVYWDKPIMNMVELNGSTANNYVIPEMSLLNYNILIDPSDLPSRRYKMTFTVESEETLWANFHSPLSLAYSADGIQWTRPVHVNPVLRGVSDGIWGFFYHPDRRKYQLYTRRVPNLPRDISLYESFDLVNWEDRGRILVADEHDPPEMYNLHDLATPFFYADFLLGLVGTMYFLPGAEGHTVFNKPPDDWPVKNLGVKDTQLAYSRDGVEWIRLEDRVPVIAAGPDEGCIFPSRNGPIVRDGETWMYYTANVKRHTFWSQEETLARHGNDARMTCCCMLAKMPEDHWVSLDAGSKGGWFLAKVYGSPSRLLVNADAKGGSIEAEIVTPYGQPVEGFTRADCIGISDNGKDQEIRWKTSVDPRSLNETHVGGMRMKFYLRNAKLYSYSMTEPDPDGDIKRYWDNARYNEIIKHRSNNWGRNNNEPASGLPQPVTQDYSGTRFGPNPRG